MSLKDWLNLIMRFNFGGMMPKKKNKTQVRYSVDDDTRRAINLLSALEDVQPGVIIEKAVKYYYETNDGVRKIQADKYQEFINSRSH